jgi:general secretion pathway protein K
MSSYLRPNRRLRAFALIAVLIFIVLLSLLALEFSKRSGIGLKLAVNYGESKKALYYAYGGYQAALALLRSDTNDYDGPGDFWYGALPPIPFDKGLISVRIEDEKARFNVKKLVVAQGDEWVIQERRRTMLERLFEVLELDSSLIDAMIDWQDSDDVTNPDGAEASFYANLAVPYATRNEPLVTSGELLLVKGLDRKLLFLPPSARGFGGVEEIGALDEYITVYGDGKININTAGLPVLLSLSRDMDEYIARDIIEYRENHPIRKKEDLKNVESVTDLLYDEIDSLIDIKSNIYRITADGISNEIVRRVVAVVMRQSKGFRVVYFNRSL